MFWIIPASVLALALITRALLNPVLTLIARRLLAKDGGTISSVQLSLRPLELRLLGLALFIDAAAALKRKTAKSIEKDTHPFSLQRLLPLRLKRVELRRGEVTFVGKDVPKIRVHDIELAIDNIATRRALDKNLPSLLTLRARIQNSGILTVMAQADALASLPAFTGQAQLEHLQLQDFGGFIAAKTGVEPNGTFDCFVTFSSVNGQLDGAIKPIWRNAEIDPAGRSVGAALKAGLAGMAIELINDDRPGGDAVATALPIKGTLTQPDPEIWPTILGVVRNAFVAALSSGFADMAAPRKRKQA